MFNEALASTELPHNTTLLPFGESADNVLHPTGYMVDESGTTFTISEKSCPALQLPLLGRHQMINALGAIAAAHYFGVSYERIGKGLRQIEATGMRNERIKLGASLVLNDAYKSNPSSLRAALETLYALQRSPRRRIAVLGDMVELGEQSEAFHREIGADIDMEQIDVLLTIGPRAAVIAEEAQARFPEGQVAACSEKGEIVDRLRAELKQNECVILIKGSRQLRLEEIIEALRGEVPVS